MTPETRQAIDAWIASNNGDDTEDHLEIENMLRALRDENAALTADDVARKEGTKP